MHDTMTNIENGPDYGLWIRKKTSRFTSEFRGKGLWSIHNKCSCKNEDHFDEGDVTPCIQNTHQIVAAAI